MNKTVLVNKLKWGLKSGRGVSADFPSPKECTSKELADFIIGNYGQEVIKESIVIITSDNKFYDLDLNEINTTNNEGDVNMNTTVNNTINNEELNDKKDYFEYFNNLVDQTAEMMANTKQMDLLKRLIDADDNVVYDELINTLDKISIRRKVSASVATRLLDKKDEIEIAVQDMESDTPESKKSELWARIKSIVKAAIRKIVAFLEGTAWFAIDTTAVLGVAATRIVVSTGKELFNAGKAIGKSFKTNIFDSIKNA